MNEILLLSAGADLLTKLLKINSVLQKSRSEGRDVTKEELAALDLEDDAAKLALDQAIAQAKLEGR